MSTRKHALFEAMLARISLGAVPVDGLYWFDPRAAREAAGKAAGAAANRPADLGQKPFPSEPRSPDVRPSESAEAS